MRRAVPGKDRVHELAKELGITSKDVLAKLKEQGEFVKSASSTVEAPVARRLREALGSTTAAAPAPSPAGRPAAPAAPRAPPAARAPPPPRRPHPPPPPPGAPPRRPDSRTAPGGSGPTGACCRS